MVEQVGRRVVHSSLISNFLEICTLCYFRYNLYHFHKLFWIVASHLYSLNISKDRIKTAFATASFGSAPLEFSGVNGASDHRQDQGQIIGLSPHQTEL